jgi:hypothetical protein
MDIEDIIKCAEDEWDMDRLCQDIGITKYRVIASKEKKEIYKYYKVLCAVLCGYQLEEIAEIMDIKLDGLKVDITNNLNDRIKPLIQERLGQEVKRLNPNKIPMFFGKLGYKAKIWTIKIRGEKNEISPEQIQEAIIDLSKKLGNAFVTLEEVNEGSIILKLKSCQQAFELAKALFGAGELSDLVGIPILDVQPVTTEPRKTLEEQETLANSLFSRCRREGYDWVELPQILEILDAVRLAYLTRKEAIKAALEELLFPDSLVGALQKSGDDNSQNNSEEEELDPEFLNTLTEEVIRFYEK